MANTLIAKNREMCDVADTLEFLLLVSETMAVKSVPTGALKAACVVHDADSDGMNERNERSGTKTLAETDDRLLCALPCP